MKKNKKTTDSPDLRKRAEKEFEIEYGNTTEMSSEKMIELIQMLQVHQIELKMQNDEFRRIQADFENSRNKYSHLYDFAPVGYITLSENGLIDEVNHTFASILGMNRSELIGGNFTRFVQKEDQDIFYKHQKMVMNSSTLDPCELRVVRKDNHEIYVRLEAVIIQNYDNANQIRVAVSDITERKKAEEALQESEENYRVMMEATRDTVYICSPNFIIEYMNPAMIKQIGRDATGEICYNALHGLEKNCSWCKHDRVLEGEYLDQTITSTKDNHSFHVSHAPIRNKDGSISKMAVYRDITELKRSEEKLKESENKFKAVAEQALAGIYLIQDGNFKYVNPKFVEMFGYTKDEYLEKIFFPKLVYPEDLSKVKEQIKKRETGKVKTVQYTFRGLKKSGEMIYVEIFGSNVMLDGKLSAIGTILDVSDRRLAEQEREKLIFDLQKALKDVKKLSGLLPICSHCKNIRDDKGYWTQIEEYISDKSDAEFSHGVCQKCTEKYYPDMGLYDD